MNPLPRNEPPKQTEKMKNKILFISGADSGIDKACALLFLKEGRCCNCLFKRTREDARDTMKKIEQEYGRLCLLISQLTKIQARCTDKYYISMAAGL